ncbi:MAG: UvrD-helicase domain-containing protein [Alphaproteobacteria bacterium]|nr:UvrD-helicase domain-containing protein [Alphaproteobacteria bacterium]
MTKKAPISEEQEVAAEPTNNVWVQANAGTGKTSVLTERLLRILFRSGEPIGGILCLTYTNAAAGEMRNRILKSLREWAMASDDDLRELLHGITTNAVASDDDIKHARDIFFKYIDNPEILKIKTIHGFCEEILRRFPTEAGISPSWSLISDAPQKVMLHDALEQVVNSTKLDENTVNAFEHIIGVVSEYKFDDLLENVEQQYKNFFCVDNFVNYRSYFVDTIKKKLNLTQEKIWTFDPNSMKLLLSQCSGVKKPTERLKGLINYLEQYTENTTDFQKYRNCYLFNNGKVKTGLNYDFLADEINRVLTYNNYIVNKKIYDDTIALFDLAAAFAKSYQELKQSRNVLDFEDLILYTHRLFSNSETMGWVLSQMDTSLSHILVDEAQDTGPIQWEVFQLLVGDFLVDGDKGNLPRSLFVVGDTKQSIYGFQGADPAAFAQSRSKIASYIQNNARQIGEPALTQNFRSVKPILDMVDMFFGDTTVIAKTGFQNNSHKCFRANDLGCVELYKSVSSYDQDTKIVRRQYIHDIADKIEDMIKSGRHVPGDIMILVQRRNQMVSGLSNELKRRGITVAGSDRIVLPEFPVIKDLMNLVRFCINNNDDYSLGCVLKSPIFAMDDAAVYDICAARNDETKRRRALDKNAPYVTVFEFVKIMRPDIYAVLNDFIEKCAKSGPYTFFTYVLNNYDIRENMIAALGVQIIDPLEEFLTMCLAYERTQTGTLRHFLKWFITSASEIKRDMDSGDGVRIVTVHGSKGLQSPVVFLVDTTVAPKFDNFYNIVNDDEIHDKYHVWLWTPHKPDEISAEFNEFKSATERKSIEESFRLLYVAMTRACDELYIYGFTTNKTTPELSWHNMLWQTLGKHYNVGDDADKIRISNYDE